MALARFGEFGEAVEHIDSVPSLSTDPSCLIE